MGGPKKGNPRKTQTETELMAYQLMLSMLEIALYRTIEILRNPAATMHLHPEYWLTGALQTLSKKVYARQPGKKKKQRVRELSKATPLRRQHLIAAALCQCANVLQKWHA